jgi:signal transduction histidine kinase
MRKGKDTSIRRATGTTDFDMSLQDIMEGVEDELVVIDGEYRVKFANAASRMAGEFAQNDLHLLNSISCQLGTAIERAKLYEQLSKARERYQILLQQALTAQEQERKRIARELHDETSQTLTGLALNLQAVIDMVEKGSVEGAELVAKLKKVHSLSVHTGTEVSKLIKELPPTLLDALGLPAAIRCYIEDSLQSQGIDVSVDFIGMDERLPSDVEMELFRIAQGAIGNIVEHSEAKNATIFILLTSLFT